MAEDDEIISTAILPEIDTFLVHSPNVLLEHRLDDNLNANIDEPHVEDNLKNKNETVLKYTLNDKSETSEDNPNVTIEKTFWRMRGIVE